MATSACFEQEAIAIERTIREDLGIRAPSLLAKLDRTPISAASIGQAHRATLDDGAQVAVKVRHPGIEAAIRADLKTAAIGRFLARAVVPGANVAEVIAEARERFLEDCDYALEAQRQSRFFEIFHGHHSITIPRVHLDWCGSHVLTTTFHAGAGLETFLDHSGSSEVRDLAEEAGKNRSSVT